MDAGSVAYQKVNKEWLATCRILLGREVGGLSEYSGWLSSLSDRFFVRKSSLSRKEVVFGSDAYCPGAGIISFDEVDFTRRFEPISINDTKDIDSLLSAVRERAFYCGNIIIGNSRFVESGSGVTDSFYVYRSVKVSGSKNVAYSQYLRLCECMFGVNEGGSSKFCIRGAAHYFNQRSLELWGGGNCSDCYFSYGVDDCKDCMFCFNMVGKSHAIGNCALPKEKYLAIKRKLLGEIAEELEKNKGLPSLVDIVSKCDDPITEVSLLLKGKAPPFHDEHDMGKIEQAFSETTRVLLGKPLSGIDRYAAWLSRVNPVPIPAKSAASGIVVQTANYPCMAPLPKDRLLTLEEGRKLGELSAISAAQAEKLSFAEAHKSISRLAFFPPERRIGSFRNLPDCCWGASASDSYKVIVAGLCKHCAYSTWPRSSDHLAGCGMVYESEFSMRCHDSVEIKRCFEVDFGRQCSDCYYCHNVEGMQNALFCFNAKNLRYAVGNAEVGKERFGDAKKMLQGYLLEQLEKKKDVPLCIFNAACAGKI